MHANQWCGSEVRRGVRMARPELSMQLDAWRLPAAGRFPAEECRGRSSRYFIFRMPKRRALNTR